MLRLFSIFLNGLFHFDIRNYLGAAFLWIIQLNNSASNEAKNWSKSEVRPLDTGGLFLFVYL